MRAAFYRLACNNTSDEISVGFLTIFSHADTTIERGVYIGPQCNIGKCIIQKSALIGSCVNILSGDKQHNFRSIDSFIQEQGGTYLKIKIGADCWIGNGSIVMCDVPTQCIIGAGSVLRAIKLTSGDIIAGNPASVIKNRLRTSA